MPQTTSIRARWREYYDFSKDVWERFSEDRVPLAAGAIAFFTLLSLFPLLLLAVSIAVFFISLSTAEHEIRNLTVTLGTSFAQALFDQFLAIKTNKGLLTGLSLFLGLWAGSQIFMVLEAAMNQAWRVQKKRPYWARRGLALLMVLLVSTLMLCAVVLSNMIRFAAHLHVPLWGHEVQDQLPWLITGMISVVVPMLLVSAIFAAIYRVLPAKRTTIRSVLPGAFTAGGLWIVMLHLFSWYATYITNYQILYGSFWAVVTLMFWLYYSAVILLLGAEISAANHRRLLAAGDRDEQRVEFEDQDDFLCELDDEPARVQISM
jgi:membrane protein